VDLYFTQYYKKKQQILRSQEQEVRSQNDAGFSMLEMPGCESEGGRMKKKSDIIMLKFGILESWRE